MASTSGSSQTRPPQKPSIPIAEEISERELTIKTLDGSILQTCMGVTLKDRKQSPYALRDVDYDKFTLEMHNAAEYDPTKHTLTGLNAKGQRKLVRSEGMLLLLMLDWTKSPTDQSWKLQIQEKGKSYSKNRPQRLI